MRGQDWDAKVNVVRVNGRLTRVQAEQAVTALFGARPKPPVEDIKRDGWFSAGYAPGANYATLRCLQDDTSTVDVPLDAFEELAAWMTKVQESAS